MANDTRLTSIATILVVGSLFWMMLVFADTQDSPAHTALKFMKAYYNLDPSMTELMCEDLKVADDVDVVEEFIYAKSVKAAQKGFGTSWEKSALHEVKIETVSADAESVSYKISGVLRKNIHPAFSLVATIFHIGESHHVTETVNLVMEDGSWKVCGSIFDS